MLWDGVFGSQEGPVAALQTLQQSPQSRSIVVPVHRCVGGYLRPIHAWTAKSTSSIITAVLTVRSNSFLMDCRCPL